MPNYMFTDKLSTLFSQAFFRLGRMPGYTLLSMLGLVISLSGTVIITRYLHQEWTIDSWMPERDRICMTQKAEYENEGQQHLFAAQKQMEGCQPITEMDGVEAATEVFLRSLLTVKLVDNETFTVNAISADSDFVRVFPLQAVEGTLDLRAAGNAIISQGLAKKLFPGESAVGQTFTVDNVLHTVTGVFREPDTKSTLHYEMVNNSANSAWFNNSISFLFTKLREGWTIEQFNGQQVKQKGLSVFKKKEILFCYQLSPFTVLEHYANDEKWPSLSKHSSPSHLWMLFAVGVLLFLVGVFNFLNLYAVMRRTRDHEMKVRRIFGASKWNIFSMLYVENLLISSPAMLGVWMVIELTTPHMKDWFAIEQITMPVFDTALSLSIMFILPLLATARPTPSPSLVGRGGVTTALMRSIHYTPSPQGRAGGGSGVSFLFLQYFISISLITVSLYLMRQLHTMMDSDPGYRTEGLMHYTPRERMELKLKVDDKGHRYYADERKGGPVILQKLKECPYIQRIAKDPDINQSFEMEANGHKVLYFSMRSTQMEMFGLELLEGRMLCDSLDLYNYNCMMNETALKQLGIKDWRTAEIQMGRRLWTTNMMELNKQNPPFKVVGILRDFHPGRLSEPVPAMLFFHVDRWKIETSESLPDDLLLLVKPGCEEALLKYLHNISQEVLGTDKVDYQWLADQKDDLYKEDRRTARIFFTFSFLAIAVTCLGVLGLMMFDVRRRYREIALRKVHGARFRDIALLLSRRYIIILGAAACVSIPVSLIGLHKLITRYYTIHATIAWWIPLLSLLIVFLLSALTLWYQIWRATRIEPSIVMKVE
jgi:ABC-type antimicrobial peptide transport system permease subunit